MVDIDTDTEILNRGGQEHALTLLTTISNLQKINLEKMFNLVGASSGE